MTMTMKRMMMMMIRRRIFNDEIVVIVLLEASRRVQGAKAEENSRLQCPTQLASGQHSTYLFFDSIGKIMKNVQERKRLDHGCFVGKEESPGKHHRRQH